MTLVVALKVGDGVILGADSASTIIDSSNNVLNSYFNAEKVFNLVKGLPLGALTYGLGGLQNRSMTSILKDLRRKLSNERTAEWGLTRATYTVEQVAASLKRFVFDDLYSAQFGAAQTPPALGFFVAGYSANATSSEIWRVQAAQHGPAEVSLLASRDVPWSAHWEGQTEACIRLIRGWSWALLTKLVDAGMSHNDAMQLLDSVPDFVHPTMPIQDAIDLVHYLITATCGFVRFSPGPAVVAEPIDSAAITLHEGFKWIRRKHYYDPQLNPALG